MSYVAHSKRARLDSYDNNHHASATLVDHKEQRLLHVAALFLSEDWADVHFAFGADVLPGHKSVLAVNAKWRELLSGAARLDMAGWQTTAGAFRELLRYLYTGVLHADDHEPELLAHVRALAERLQMWELVTALLELESAAKVSLESALRLLADAPLESAAARACLAFIAANAQDVLCQDEFYDLPDAHAYAVLSRDDLSASEQVVFEAVRRYASGANAGDGDRRRVVSAVRFALLPFEYLWINVRKFAEDKPSLLSLHELTALSTAKAKVAPLNPEIRSRAFCLPGVDVVALRGKDSLATRVLRGKVGEVGDEASAVELDLGLPYFVNGVALLFSASTKSRYSFRLEVSVDGNKWQLVYDFAKYHTSNKVDLAFEARVVRFVRVAEGTWYPDWAERKKETKPVRKVANVACLYEEPTGVVTTREHLLASKYLFAQMACDFTYKSWYKKNGKNFYVCALNDPIVAVLQQPVWMDTIQLYIPEEDEREFNFVVEVTASPDATFKGRDKWQLVGNYREESRRGEVQVNFEPTVVNAFRVTGTRVVNGKGKDKDFAVEIRI